MSALGLHTSLPPSFVVLFPLLLFSYVPGVIVPTLPVSHVVSIPYVPIRHVSRRRYIDYSNSYHRHKHNTMIIIIIIIRYLKKRFNISFNHSFRIMPPYQGYSTLHVSNRYNSRRNSPNKEPRQDQIHHHRSHDASSVLTHPHRRRARLVVVISQCPPPYTTNPNPTPPIHTPNRPLNTSSSSTNLCLFSK